MGSECESAQRPENTGENNDFQKVIRNRCNAASGMTNNPLIFTVTNANPAIVAVFPALSGPETNALTVIPNGRGEVTLTPRGHLFPRNANVVLQAVPGAGQDFLG